MKLKMPGPWKSFGLLAAGLLSLAPRPSEACSLRLPGLMLAPIDGASGVPINAEPLLSTNSMYGMPAALCTAPESGEGAGVPVAARIEALGSTYVRIIPEALLHPETAYSISSAADCSGRVGGFTTGTTEDTTPPDFPGVTSVVADAYSPPLFARDGCATAAYSFYRLEMPEPVDAEAGTQVLRLVYEGPSMDTVDLSRPALALDPWEERLSGNLSPDKRNKLAVVVTALDWAGNESAPQVPVMAQNTCGCQGSGAGGLAALGMLLLPILARRRVASPADRP